MQTQVRVTGSGFSTFLYNNTPLLWLEGIEDSGMTVKGGNSGVEVITPLGSNNAVEIVTGRVLNPGTLTATVRELWNTPAWQQLQGLAGTSNLAEVFAAMYASGTITCQFIIKPPGQNNWRGWVYNNCSVVKIDDTERVTVGSMSVARSLDIIYLTRTPFVGQGLNPVS